ncbi:MAG: sulfurtransferase [Deltaproteobacteria bacterium]|nr:sulfurtransferase [Deltaproteobacteria bacterium]
MLLRLLAPLTVAALTLMSSAVFAGSDGPARAPVKVVDVRGAVALIARGAAVLDARDAAAFAQGHVPGAQMYAWQATTGEGSQRGRVKPDLQQLAHALAALGVDAGRPALVYGAVGQGWGEEGHAAWLLALLGHPEVALLDGGFNAWRAAGRPVVTSSTRARPGTFEARLRRELRADLEDVSRCRQVLDVRATVEFRGATPYGEARGGHIAGARHLDWRAVLDEGGRVRSAQRIQQALADVGIDPREELVTYCSCGVRSAFVASALLARGIPRVRNYDGSLAEWAADPSRPMAR